MDDLLSLPIEDQARACDYIALKMVLNNDPDLTKQIKSALQLAPQGFDGYNSTSVGNMARIIVSSPNEELKKLAIELHTKFVAYCRNPPNTEPEVRIEIPVGESTS